MKADTGQLQEFLKLNDISAMVMSIASRSFPWRTGPFVFILDEMTTFKVRDFEKLPSVLREYGAAFLLLTQSEGKLEKLYSKLDRSSIEANFGNIFLGRTQDVEALKYYPLFFGKYEKEKKSTSSGSSGGGRNSSVTISTQKEEIYESKDFASLEPGEFIGMGNRSNIKGHFRKKFRLFELEEEPLPVVAFRTEKEISDNLYRNTERYREGARNGRDGGGCKLPVRFPVKHVLLRISVSHLQQCPLQGYRLFTGLRAIFSGFGVKPHQKSTTYNSTYCIY